MDRKRDQEEKKGFLIICRLSLDKCGGKCHSIQQPPRAAACLDIAFPKFLLITAWEIFGRGRSACVCWKLTSLPPAGGFPGWCTGSGDPGRITLCQGHCHWHGDTPVAPQPCGEDAATSPGAASNSGYLLRNSRVGTDRDHGGHGCPDRHCPCHCPTAEGHRAPTEPVPPGMALCPCAGPQ